MSDIYDKALTEWREARRALFEQGDSMSERDFYLSLVEMATDAISTYPFLEQLTEMDDLPVPSRMEARRKLARMPSQDIPADGVEEGDEAYRAGLRSYFQNKGALINPHSRGSDAHWKFERGWSQALRRQPESAFTPTNDTLQDRYEGRWHSRTSVGDRSVNRYAETKGKSHRK